MRAAEPLSTLKAADRWLSKPVRIDAKNNRVIFDADGWHRIQARVRAQIARLQNHASNGGGR